VNPEDWFCEVLGVVGVQQRDRAGSMEHRGGLGGGGALMQREAGDDGGDDGW